MPFVIPKSVGGTGEDPIDPVQKVEPIEKRIERFVIPESVGGPVNQEAPVQPAKQEAAKTGIMDIFTGSERIKATPELGTFPEFGSTPEGDALLAAIDGGDTKAAAKISAGFLSTASPEAQLEIIKSAIPDAVFETTPDGSTIIETKTASGETRRSVLNRPGFSPQDLTTSIAQVLAFIPAAKIATLGKTLLKKVGLGAVAAGATEQGLQEAGIAGLGRETRAPTETAIATVTGGLAETVVPAVQAFRGARQAKQIGTKTAEVEAARQAIKPAQDAVEGLRAAAGKEVGLFKAQQTQLPTDLLKQRVLPQLDAGSAKAAAALEAQNKDAFEATSELINTIAGPEVTIKGAKQFRSAAEKALKAANNERRTAVKPLYDAAFKESRESGGKVDLTPVTDFVESELKNLVSDDPASVALNSFLKRLSGDKLPDKPQGLIIGKEGKSLIEATKGGNKPLTLEQLQSAKFTTDAQIDKSGGLVLNSAQKNAKRLLSQAEKLYIDQLGKLSPAFKRANEEFARLSPAVKEVEDSLIGVAAKIKDVDLQNISRRIFSPNSNPVVVKNAKTLIDQVDPDAWNNMLRGELQRRIGGIETLAEDIPGELVGNVPGQLRRAIFGNPEQRRTLLSAMSEDQRKNFVYLDDVLRRASSGRAAGSPTAAFGQAIEKLKGVGVVLRDAIFRPVKTFQETGERFVFDRNVSALTDVMFDPKYKPRLDKLRKINPDGPEAGTIMKELLDAAKASAQVIAKDEDL